MLVPRLAILLAVGFSSFSAVLVRLSGAPAVTLAQWRMIFSAAAVVLWIAIRNTAAAKNRFLSGIEEGAGRRVSWKTHLLVVASGALLALHFGAWFLSLEYTSVAHSTILVTMHPLPVMVFSAVILREPLRRTQVLQAVLALGGVALLASEASGGGRGTSLAGDVMAFSGALAVGGYLLIGRYARRSLSTAVYTARVYTVAALCLAGATWAAGQPLLLPLWEDVVIALLLALVCTIMGHSVFSWAMGYVPATEVSLAVLMEPVAATVMAMVIFHEMPGGATVAGGVIILASLVWAVMPRKALHP